MPDLGDGVDDQLRETRATYYIIAGQYAQRQPHRPQVGAGTPARIAVADPPVGERVLATGGTFRPPGWGHARRGSLRSPTVSGGVGLYARVCSHGRKAIWRRRRLDDDLVRDMVEVLTSLCARPYGRRSARNRAEKALEAAADG